MNMIDYAALGFRLSLDNAAETLGISVEEIGDLLLCNEMAALLTSDAKPGGARTLRFRVHPEEVLWYGQRRRSGAFGSGSHNAARVRRALRAYLAARPPVDSYDQAVLTGHPVRSVSGRADRPAPVNVRPEVLSQFHAENSDEFSLPVLVIERALEELGAVRARGMIALGDSGTSKQRWAYWYRLPTVLTQPFSEHNLAVALLGRTVTTGESVTTAGGRPVLSGSLRGADDLDEEEYTGDYSDV